MRKEEPSNNVKLAATNALLNSLEFTKANFDKEVRQHTHRVNYISLIVTTTTRLAGDPDMSVWFILIISW